MESKTVETEVVFLEGLDKTLGKRIQADLQAVGFVVGIHDDPHYRDSKIAQCAIAPRAVGAFIRNGVSLCASHSYNPLTGTAVISGQNRVRGSLTPCVGSSRSA